MITSRTSHRVLCFTALVAAAGCTSGSAESATLDEPLAAASFHAAIAGAARGLAPDGYLATPHGFFHPSCVLTLGADETQRADGSIVRADGSVRAVAPCRFLRFDRRGHAVRPDAPPPQVNGWVESSSNASQGALSFVSANWRVPPAPAIQGGQVIYYFPGLEDIEAVQTIVQPVLGWAGGGWTIASWNCCKDGNVTHSNPVAVRDGDQLYGYAQGTGCDSRGQCPSWRIYTADQSTGQSTTLDSSSFGQIFDWSFGAVLEAYAVDHCAQYPASGAATFSNITVRKVNGATANIAWPSGTGGGSPDCGYVYTASGTSVTLASTATRAAVPPRPSGCGSIAGGQGLIPGQSYASCDGRFSLAMQLDGNLVLYQGATQLWATGTWGTTGFEATQQGDGNFVLYDMTRRAMWAAGTWGHPGSRLAVQNDGNLVVYSPSNQPLWASNTCCR